MIALNQPFQLLTETECADFISRARTLEMVKGQTYTNQTHVRTNDIIWFSFTEDERNRFWELIKDYWGQVHWYEHPVQISIYKPGQYYDWHTDDKPNRKRSSKRHLTLTCNLQCAPGALFETRLDSYDLKLGEAIIIPSESEHRACAPTESERWSLTIWYMKKKNAAETES